MPKMNKNFVIGLGAGALVVYLIQRSFPEILPAKPEPKKAWYQFW